jgi:hypothetical protein
MAFPENGLVLFPKNDFLVKEIAMVYRISNSLLASLVVLALIPAARAEDYLSSAGRYRVMLPGAAETDSLRITIGSYSLDLHMTMGKGTSSAAGVTYFDVPTPDIGNSSTNEEELMDAMRNGMVASVGGELHRDKAVTLGNLKGREFEIRSKKATAIVRLYRVSNRFYQVAYFSQKAEPSYREVSDFFDSFQLR